MLCDTSARCTHILRMHLRMPLHVAWHYAEISRRPASEVPFLFFFFSAFDRLSFSFEILTKPTSNPPSPRLSSCRLIETSAGCGSSGCRMCLSASPAYLHYLFFFLSFPFFFLFHFSFVCRLAHHTSVLYPLRFTSPLPSKVTLAVQSTDAEFARRKASRYTAYCFESSYSLSLRFVSFCFVYSLLSLSRYSHLALFFCSSPAGPPTLLPYSALPLSITQENYDPP